MRLIALAALALLCGCAQVPMPPLPADAPRIELAETPFFPQRALHCGPAALATVLGASGVDITADALANRLFVPARGGALQIELLAAPREHGRLALRLDGTFEALLAQLRNGRPVLVLQNLLLERLPRWHFAVVVGYDPATDQLILRSGGDARLRVSRTRFLATWVRAGRWAMVVAAPQESPADFRPEQWFEAAAALESAGYAETALAAFTRAARVWPEDPVADLGRGNALWALGRPAAAMRAWRAALVDQPLYAPALNNLVHAHLDRGEWCAAVALLPPPEVERSSEEPAPIQAARRAIAEHAETLGQPCGPIEPIGPIGPIEPIEPIGPT
ncbi:MAG: PA2778 family cysteine peptidase [Gammaproteobacteria bacterium]